MDTSQDLVATDRQVQYQDVEEALNSLQKSDAEKRELEEKLHKLFSQEHLVVRNEDFQEGFSPGD